jgi:hypothetical protein
MTLADFEKCGCQPVHTGPETMCENNRYRPWPSTENVFRKYVGVHTMHTPARSHEGIAFWYFHQAIAKRSGNVQWCD